MKTASYLLNAFFFGVILCLLYYIKDTKSIEQERKVSGYTSYILAEQLRRSVLLLDSCQNTCLINYDRQNIFFQLADSCIVE